MRIFLSWSGQRSKAVAEILHEWLPFVLQSVKPWLSASDIDKGTRWSADIASQLQDTLFGIICLTPENLEAPWINFEAGALSKTLDASFVCPYLFEVDPADIKGPLVQFQATKFTKDDTKKLIDTINRASQDSLSEQQLNKSFEVWWPDLEMKLKSIPTISSPPHTKRSDRDLLEEILEILRDQARESVCKEAIENLEWPVGARVAHPKFGPGIIVKSEGTGDNATAFVSFEKYGTKKLHVKLAKMEKLS
jgi:hypothetical protein